MAIGITEQISGPCIFYMKPTGRKSDYRNHKFPAMLVVSSEIYLAANPGARTFVLSLYINYLPIENTEYGVVSPDFRY